MKQKNQFEILKQNINFWKKNSCKARKKDHARRFILSRYMERLSPCKETIRKS